MFVSIGYAAEPGNDGPQITVNVLKSKYNHPRVFTVADDALAWFIKNFGWTDRDGDIHQAAIS